MTLNTEFTSPPSCQCERALVRCCQLHCWNLTFTGMWGVVKTIKVSRKNCVVSSFVSSGVIFVLDSAPCLCCNVGGKGKQVQHSNAQPNTMQRCWERKEWMKMWQCCRFRLSPETCLSGLEGKAFYFGGFFISSIPKSLQLPRTRTEKNYVATRNKDYFICMEMFCIFFCKNKKTAKIKI